VWAQLGRPIGVRVVGGYLRDRLLGRPTGDLDLTMVGDADSTARPARRFASTRGIRAHLLGSAPHRVWRIESPDLKVEIWPLDGLTLEEDIRRRDFTCNTLCWELPGGPLVDLVGGFDDIEARSLRAVARANLENDPVRLLRAARFLAQLDGFELEARTRSWIRELASLLNDAPRERVGRELSAMLRAAAAARGLETCLDLGLFTAAAPEGSSPDPTWVRDNIHAVSALSARYRKIETPTPPTAYRRCGAGVPPAGCRSGSVGDAARLAFLFRAWGHPTEGRLAPYSWPRSDRERACCAARLLDDALESVNAPPADRRELAWRAGASFPALLALGQALDPAQPGWRRWRRQWCRDPGALLDPRPLLSGEEIARITGIEPGPELGTLVRALLRAQVRGEIRSTSGAATMLARCRDQSSADRSG
jgi:tRNA nucleotidyltransferase (CCA-adding enzyme)